MDAARGNAGGVGHYHVDSCENNVPASPDRNGVVPTDTNGQPITQDQNYQQRYEPGATTYNDSHERVDKPQAGGPNAAPDMNTWARETHQPI